MTEDVINAIAELVQCEHSIQVAMRIEGGGVGWLRCPRCGAWKPPGGNWLQPLLLSKLAETIRSVM